MALRGSIDLVEDGVLRGWYYAEDGSKELRVFADGALLGIAVADRFREDLLAAGIGDGAHAFEFVLPASLCDGARHEFAIAHKADGARATERALETGRRVLSLVGQVERLVDGKAEGWAFDRGDPGARLQVAAFENDSLVGSATADLPREDLVRAGVGDGRHAFAMSLPHEACRRADPVEWTFRVDEAHGGAVIAVVRLAALAALAPADGAVRYSDLTAPCDDALVPISDLLFLQSDDPEDLDDAEVTVADDGVDVTTLPPRGAVRLLHRFPGVQSLLRDDWLIEIAFGTPSPVPFSVSLVEFRLEAFERLLPLADETTAPPGRHRFEYWTTSRRARSRDPDIRERPIFLALETRSALALERFQVRIERREAQAETIPFCASEHPHFAQLADLNDRLSGVGKRDPDAWALEAAEAALRLECLETASGLVERIDLMKHEPKLRLRFLRVFVEVAFAEGRLDDVRARLRENWSLTRSDDVLFAAFSACFPATAELRGFFAELPSGRPNLFWLVRHPQSSEVLAASLGDALDGGQGDLLWANLTRELGARDYLAGWNRYLRRFDLAGLASVDLSHRNVLSTFSFEPSPSRSGGPLVSVIMSAFNASDTVLYAARSILGQTHETLELLICDDMSDDGTPAVLELLRGVPRVRLFQSRGNQGPYNIRNHLLREARGRYVTFQDADDVAHPARIARQLAEIERTERPFVLSRWIRVRPDGEAVFFRDQVCPRLSLVSLLAEQGAIERFGGFRPVLCGADSEFAQRLRAPGVQKVYSELEEPLIFGLWSAQSLTRQEGLEATEDGLLSKTRRVYAENAARRNLLGDEIVPDATVDEVNRRLGIYREDLGVVSLEGGL